MASGFGSRSRRVALQKCNNYKYQSILVSNTVSEDALKEVHCKHVPVGSEELYHIIKRCERCPKFKQPTMENLLKTSSHFKHLKLYIVVLNT